MTNWCHKIDGVRRKFPSCKLSKIGKNGVSLNSIFDLKPVSQDRNIVKKTRSNGTLIVVIVKVSEILSEKDWNDMCRIQIGNIEKNAKFKVKNCTFSPTLLYDSKV